MQRQDIFSFEYDPFSACFMYLTDMWREFIIYLYI